jgi:3-oxoadipate enol-lactonase
MALISTPSGVRLSARVDGPANGPGLVLSNSITATHAMWNAQMDVLTKRYRVLRYDTRGHGESDAPVAPYLLPDLVDDAVALMDHFEMDRPVFLGLSLGGMTGLGVALTHPTRIKSLVCCDARADAPAPFVTGWDDRVKMVRDFGIASIVPGTIERWLSPAFRAANPDVVADVEKMILTTSVAGYEGCAAALKRLNYLERLDQIAMPALFVVGSEDMGAPPAVMKGMAERVSGADFALIEGSAHLPNIDNAEGFQAAVSRFLGLH